MKKISLFLMAFGLVAASCTTSDFENVYGEDPHADFSQAFVQTFGNNIDPDHDWGFGSSLRGAAMRGVVKPDMTNYPTENIPADVTAQEAAYVQQWFEENPGLSEEGLDIKNFFVQYVSSKIGNKQGIWHKYDQNKPEGEKEWDEEFTASNPGMDYLVVGDGNGNEDHVLDFNFQNSGSYGIVYIENGSALQWGYHSSWGEDQYAPNGNGIYYFFKLAEIDVPGVGKGWYIGLSIYGQKYDNGMQEMGIQRLDYAEDWIFKLTPAEPIQEPEPEWVRIIAEDLGSIGDFDYNDVVFDAYIDNAKQAHIILRAAGGTMPLYVGNVEVHQEFGVPTTTMVNTGVNGKIDYNKGKEITLEGTYENVIDIPIIVYPVGKESYELTVTRGAAPEKIAVTPDYEWTEEYKNIRETYPLFEDYVQNKDTKWY